jgi:lipid A ethanolaminephosphotransferase
MMRAWFRVSPGRHPLAPILLSALWLATVANVPLWRQLAQMPELQDVRGLAFAVGFGVVLFLLHVTILSLLAWRWSLKPVLTLFFVSAAAGAYFMLSYGVVIDSTMMMNVLQTDPREAGDLLNWRMLAVLVLLGVLPSAVVWRCDVRPLGFIRRISTQLGVALLALAVMLGVLLLIFQDFSSVMRNHTQVRYLINPLNSFYAIGMVATKSKRIESGVLTPLGLDARLVVARPGDKPPLIVLVLGETARAASFGINGYPRQTTPRLARESVVTLRNAWSCGTSTAVSLPCMYSGLGRADYDTRKANTENLMDVLYRAGLAVLWIDNQSGCKGVCDRVPNLNTASMQVPEFCEAGECFDEVMLQQVSRRIAELPAERRARGVVVVMHQMGSHGPAYFKRTPQRFKQFLPECQSSFLQECDQAQVVNTYDNTILYTDHFLSQTIQWLKTAEKTAATAMVYVSDHGESLGESNLYLHGLPYSAAPALQKQVPWITWLSPSIERQRSVSQRCLQAKEDTRVSHDNYFHSVLGLVGVLTEVYRADLDIYAGCSAA